MPVTYFVNWKAEIDVKAENTGAVNTQTFLISTGKHNFSKIQWTNAAVAINPGYTVPPTTLPRGYLFYKYVPWIMVKPVP